MVTNVITMLLSLIILGSTAALSALVSLAFAGLFSSYLLVCGLLLWRRTTGGIEDCPDEGVLYSGRLTWGPWKLPPTLGIINNIFACLYAAFVLFWSFWPQSTPTTLASANWSALIFAFVVAFSVFWYMFRARYYFKGPIREV